VHPEPARAASDGGQTLDFAAFGRMMAICRKVAAAVGKTM